ncbi:MAG: nicotinate-nucleotide adenylyltransferase [Pseudomonadota bacterium]|nr:nicotinate-nucleotide adenylyltransferase [Pseudomonadota bacterium]
MSLRIQYGGSYDPVHNGHLAVADAARISLDADVWLMPAADPPHKPATAASAEQRLAMLQLAIAERPGLQFDVRELRRAGPSWTIDTLRELRAELGQDVPLAILIGADSFLALTSWRSWRALSDYAHIVIAERPGSPLHAHTLPAPLADFAAERWCEQPSDLHRSPAGGLYRLPLPLRAESSSALRRMIANGDPAWRAWLPATVAEYITQQHLYGAV